MEETQASKILSGVGNWLLYLALILIVLRICSLIDWNWLFVLIPLFIGLVLYFTAAGVNTYVKNHRKASRMEKAINELAESLSNAWMGKEDKNG